MHILNPDLWIINDLLLLCCAALYEFAVLKVTSNLKERGRISGYSARKIIHLLAGFACFIVPFLYVPFLALFISGAFLLITFYSTPRTYLFKVMGEEAEYKAGYLQGPFYYALSINILVFIFSFMPHLFFFPMASIMIMMIADPIAALVGRKYGKHKIIIKYTKTIRSLEGSFALLLTAFVISMFIFSFFGNLLLQSQNEIPIFWITVLALNLAVISTIIELLSTSTLDDLSVPVAGCLASFLISRICIPYIF